MKKKVIIFGNSGSGKSTTAKRFCKKYNLAHLDLDTLAWKSTVPPSRKPLSESKKEIDKFILDNTSWVIEGCYSDLIEELLPKSNIIIYMDLPVGLCVENAKNRSWEPHKYESKEAQDANLEMLIDWIKAYTSRSDTFSKQAHSELYRKYQGLKHRIFQNADKLPV